MKNLRSLLERISKTLNRDVHTKETIIKVVRERVGVTLSPENLGFKEGVLEITAGAALKNEIRLKEEEIRAELKAAYKIGISRVIYK